VMEVVSDDPKYRKRDLETKLADCAEAKIAGYWIIDFDERRVLVHHLNGERYTLHGQFAPGQQASSALPPDFSIDVASLFAAAEDVPE